MSEECQQVILAFFGEGWPSSAAQIFLLSVRRSENDVSRSGCPYHPPYPGRRGGLAEGSENSWTQRIDNPQSFEGGI